MFLISPGWRGKPGSLFQSRVHQVHASGKFSIFSAAITQFEEKFRLYKNGYEIQSQTFASVDFLLPGINMIISVRKWTLDLHKCEFSKY
jgi:hypothetical protein